LPRKHCWQWSRPGNWAQSFLVRVIARIRSAALHDLRSGTTDVVSSACRVRYISADPLIFRLVRRCGHGGRSRRRLLGGTQLTPSIHQRANLIFIMDRTYEGEPCAESHRTRARGKKQRSRPGDQVLGGCGPQELGRKLWHTCLYKFAPQPRALVRAVA